MTDPWMFLRDALAAASERAEARALDREIMGQRATGARYADLRALVEDRPEGYDPPERPPLAGVEVHGVCIDEVHARPAGFSLEDEWDNVVHVEGVHCFCRRCVRSRS